MNASRKPLISSLFKAPKHKLPFRGQEIFGEEVIIDGDGNCCFNLFAEGKQTPQDVRNLVYKTLSDLSDKEDIRKEVSVEISGALIEEHIRLSQKLHEEWETLKKRWLIAIEKIGETRQLALKFYFPNAHTLEMESTALVEYLKEKQAQQVAEILKLNIQEESENFIALQVFYQRQDVYEAYIQCFQRDAWLGIKSAKYFAQAQGFSFFVWNKESEGKQVKWTLREEDCIEAPQPRRIICAAYMRGNHFNLLKVNEPLPFMNVPLDTGVEVSPFSPHTSDTPSLKSIDASNSPAVEEVVEDKVEANKNSCDSSSIPKQPHEPLSPSAYLYSLEEYKKFLQQAPKKLETVEDLEKLFAATKQLSAPPSRENSLDIKREKKKEKKEPVCEQDANAKIMVLNAIKLGNDRYLKFITLLINSYAYDRQQMIMSARPEVIVKIKHILDIQFQAVLLSALQIMFFGTGEFLRKIKVKDKEDYYVKLIHYIQNLHKITSQTFEKMLREILMQYATSDWSIEAEPFIKEKLEQYYHLTESIFPKRKRELKQSFLKMENSDADFLKKVIDFCEVKAKHYEEQHAKAYKIYVSGGQYLLDEIEVKHNTAHDAYKAAKRKLAEEVWAQKETMIPKANLRAWKRQWQREWEQYSQAHKAKKEKGRPKTLEEFIKAAFIAWVLGPEHWVKPDEHEEKTGNTLALLALKYNNDAIFRFLVMECGVSEEVSQRPNKQGLTISHYQCLQGPSPQYASKKIYASEPYHDELVYLEKAIRAYMDGWQQERQIREDRKESWNPISLFIDKFITSRESVSQPFKERLDECLKVLEAIEEMRDNKDPNAFKQLLSKLEHLYQESKDGPLSAFKEGKFRGILREFNQKHADQALQIMRPSAKGGGSLHFLGEDTQHLREKYKRLKEEKKVLEERTIQAEMTARKLQEEKIIWEKEKEDLNSKYEELEEQVRQYEKEQSDNETPYSSYGSYGSSFEQRFRSIIKK